jgi:uncharacterized membrane protein YhiD involved in acid resistance
MDILEIFNGGTISISDLVINILLGTLLSLGLAAYYVRFGQTYSDRTSHARILPILAITTLLVITVVKSSLALSLGLVGALSIVRFRTPIKEPEELAYLFLAIAIGLGLGANQRIATLIAVPLILVMLLIPITWTRTKSRQNTFMIMSVPSSNTAQETLAIVMELMEEHATTVDLRRMEVRGQSLEATLYVAAKNAESIAATVDAVRSQIPDAEIAFIEQEPGIG